MERPLHADGGSFSSGPARILILPEDLGQGRTAPISGLIHEAHMTDMNGVFTSEYTWLPWFVGQCFGRLKQTKTLVVRQCFGRLLARQVVSPKNAGSCCKKHPFNFVNQVWEKVGVDSALKNNLIILDKICKKSR